MSFPSPPTTKPSSSFRIGRLDHVHIRVPNRAEAVRWYSQHFGMKPVDRYQFWADGFDGGPVQLSGDGGRTMLALFEASEPYHPMIAQQTGVAFSLPADEFVALALGLPKDGLVTPQGKPLTVQDLVDLDLCWAFNVADPWGNQYEINCYEYDYVQRHVVDKVHDLKPVRYWLKSALAEYRQQQKQEQQQQQEFEETSKSHE